MLRTRAPLDTPCYLPLSVFWPQTMSHLLLSSPLWHITSRLLRITASVGVQLGGVHSVFGMMASPRSRVTSRF